MDGEIEPLHFRLEKAEAGHSLLEMLAGFRDKAILTRAILLSKEASRGDKKMSFIRWSIAIVLATHATYVLGEEVPFAQPPADHQIAPLTEIMGRIQFRHIKIWQAIQARNWDLITYEADQLKVTFGNAVIFYRNIPVEFIAAAGPPLGDLQAAAAAKDDSKLEAAFGKLTIACNSCHQAAGVGFIKIVRPTFSPFGDQQFAPDK